MRKEARWSGSGQTPGSWLLRRSRVSRCEDKRGWPFGLFNYSGVLDKRRIASPQRSAGDWRRDTEVGRDLRQALPGGLTDVGEDAGAGVAEFFFGGGGNARDYFARLMVERRDGREHPLVGDIFEPAAKMFGSLLTDARIQAAHLRDR